MNPTNEDLMDILLCWLADGFQDPEAMRAAVKLVEALRVKEPARDDRRKAMLKAIRDRNDRESYVALFGEEKTA